MIRRLLVVAALALAAGGCTIPPTDPSGPHVQICPPYCGHAHRGHR